MNILFLYESILPDNFYKDTLFLGEARVMSAQPYVKNIFVLGRSGTSFYDKKNTKSVKTKLEKKVKLIHYSKFENNLWYYFLTPIILFNALSFIRKNKIDLIQAESPHISGPAAIILGKIFNIKTAIEVRVSYHEVLKNRLKLIPNNIKKTVYDLVSNFVFSQASILIGNTKTYADILKKIISKHPKWKKASELVLKNPKSYNSPLFLILFVIFNNTI